MKALDAKRLSRKEADRVLNMEQASTLQKLQLFLEEWGFPMLVGGYVFTSDGVYRVDLDKVEKSESPHPSIKYTFKALEARKKAEIYKSVFVYDDEIVLHVDRAPAVILVSDNTYTLTFTFEAFSK